MVKITNTAGDVKTGIQGLAVYQGHYGHQVRRVKAPKRGIPSKTQLKQRDLFRLSLTWKKTLTPHDRAWLKWHATNAGVIDSFGVPLTWNRYADKICLTRPTFRTCQIGEPPSTLLIIHHPALLKVTCYRDGQLLTQCDKLSDLAAEYLTTELHLDPQPQDVIDVTTLPGVEYTYTIPGKKEEIMLEYTAVMGPIQTPDPATWTPWDLSEYLPLGTQAVEVIALGVGFNNVGVRPSGAEFNRYFAIGAAETVLPVTLQCDVGNDRTIETFCTMAPLYTFRIIGYWKPA